MPIITLNIDIFDLHSNDIFLIHLHELKMSHLLLQYLNNVPSNLAHFSE